MEDSFQKAGDNRDIKMVKTKIKHDRNIKKY